jgi:hypothetical protein
VNDTAMTRSEREDLQRLVRQREKVQKSAARQRSAELLADFDSQLAAEYRFDDDAVWAEAAKLADAEVVKAQAKVAERCRQLGIPDEFAPSLKLGWANRGYANAVKARREELRRVAQSRIAAMEASACVVIEHASVQAQTRLALAGLTSEAAKVFVEALPAVEDLMGRLSFDELAGKADPPVAHQLVAPNTLRQRRFRERAAALRNATDALPAPGETGSNDERDLIGGED